MAYTARATLTPVNENVWRLRLSESEAAQTSEVDLLTLVSLPKAVECLEVRAELVSGTGTTIAPVGGTVTNPAGGTANEQFYSIGPAAAAHHLAQAAAGMPLLLPLDEGNWFHRSVPNNAAADHVIVTTFLLRRIGAKH